MQAASTVCGQRLIKHRAAARNWCLAVSEWPVCLASNAGQQRCGAWQQQQPAWLQVCVCVRHAAPNEHILESSGLSHLHAVVKCVGVLTLKLMHQAFSVAACLSAVH